MVSLPLYFYVETFIYQIPDYFLIYVWNYDVFVDLKW